MKDARENYLKQTYDNLIQSEARLANELQQEYPQMTRTEALLEAHRILSQSGGRL